MILCIDIGNTAAKAAVVSGETVGARRVMPTAGLGDGAVLAAACRELVAAPGEPLEAVAVASVVPGAGDVGDDIAREWNVASVAVDAGVRLPFSLAVDEPATVGADRLCAAAGAVDADHRDAVVVDIGSAVTIDRVRDLTFTGGAIMPGPRMMLAALARHTARLPELDLDAIETLFPAQAHPTDRAIALGVGTAVAGGVLEAVRRLGGAGTPVWVTGGLMGRVAEAFPDHWRRDPDLTLRGLARIGRLGRRS